MTILTIGPLLGSFITEPAAMTICALLLARQFYDLQPSRALKYATLGLLFVNVSIGGTLTHFAAPPVLMVARPWGWDTAFMLGALRLARGARDRRRRTLVYYLRVPARAARRWPTRAAGADVEQPGRRRDAGAAGCCRCRPWITAVHMLFMAWTVFNAHYPALFVGGFLFFLGFAKATARLSEPHRSARRRCWSASSSPGW